VIGLTHSNAEIRLQAVHLNLRVLARNDDAPLDSGVIVFQTPQPGERVDYQATVGVTIALRPAKTEPPSSKR